MILKKDSGEEQKFCTTLMEKTGGGIGILNNDLFSDQFFLQCRNWLHQHPPPLLLLDYSQTEREADILAVLAGGGGG
jgi:hypothetical protein